MSKKQVAYFVFLFVFFLFFNYSSEIVIKLMRSDKESLPIEIVHAEYLNRLPLKYDIWTIDIDENSIKKAVAIYGNIHNLPNDAKTQKFLVLSSSTHAYAIEVMDFHEHQDVINAAFSSILIQDGMYRLGIHAIDAQEKESFAWTGRLLLKSHGKFIEYDELRKVDSIDIRACQNIIMNFSDFTTNSVSQKIEIKGWAFMQNKNTLDFNTHIQIKRDDGSFFMYYTQRPVRSDVADYFKSDLYYYSGLEADIPVDNLSEGTYQLSILLEKDGIYYKNDAAFPFTEFPSPRKGVKIYFGPEISAPEKSMLNERSLLTNKTSFHIDYVNLGNQPANDDFSQYNIVKINAARPFLLIGGWAVDTKNKDTGDSVYLKVGDEFFQAGRVVRNDIATYFDESNYEQSGFSVMIDTEKLTQGLHGAQIILITSDKMGYYVLHEFKLNIERE